METSPQERRLNIGLGLGLEQVSAPWDHHGTSGRSLDLSNPTERQVKG